MHFSRKTRRNRRPNGKAFSIAAVVFLLHNYNVGTFSDTLISRIISAMPPASSEMGPKALMAKHVLPMPHRTGHAKKKRRKTKNVMPRLTKRMMVDKYPQATP